MHGTHGSQSIRASVASMAKSKANIYKKGGKMAVLGRWWGSLARRQGPDQQRRDGTWAVGQRGGFST